MVRQSCEIETNIVSVERIKEYMEITSEAPSIVESNRPPASWPDKGQIEFADYSTRYRKELDLVLRSVHFSVGSGQKVGVVGRTGAGKSSLMLALFRLVEPVTGTIIIDGVDISRFASVPPCHLFAGFLVSVWRICALA